MTLFKKKAADPLEMLRAMLLADKTVWEMFARMPAKQQRAGLSTFRPVCVITIGTRRAQTLRKPTHLLQKLETLC